MNTLEGRIRAAMRAAGETVPPGSAPPLRLPRAPRQRTAGWLGHRPPRRRRQWHRWLAPVAAALAVTAVVTLVQLASLRVGTGAGHPAAAWAAGVPPRYVTLTYSNPALGPRGDAIVWSTVTGHQLAVVKPPGHGTFTAVTGTADATMFVLAARMPGQSRRGLPGQLRLFRLTTGGGQPVRLTVLEARVQPPGAVLTGLALSPDTSKLAMALTVGYQVQVRVVNMAGDRTRAWSGVPPRVPTTLGSTGISWVSSVSWAADNRTLAYGNQYNVRLLDTAAPGNKLLLDSPRGVPYEQPGTRVAMSCAPLSSGFPRRYFGNALLTPGADLIIASGGYRQGGSAVATIPRELWQRGVLTYPCTSPAWKQVSRGLVTARYGHLAGAVRWVYWAGRDGRTLVAVAYFGLGGRGLVGVLRDGRFTPLPGTARIPVAPEPPDAPAAW